MPPSRQLQGGLFATVTDPDPNWSLSSKWLPGEIGSAGFRARPFFGLGYFVASSKTEFLKQIHYQFYAINNFVACYIPKSKPASGWIFLAIVGQNPVNSSLVPSKPMRAALRTTLRAPSQPAASERQNAESRSDVRSIRRSPS